ncbi:MAG: SMC-Scp complex subunit ScpB [Candidatus Mcinerneyibacterium aminivorans]|jgi:segregation and condensation protein B|uniref:SMC-Scp complex subunit ScpB n=1 Tax=Candidatus Mcinerneyibacterium aminivorans TaxID=2703815 RepID=A0A5D0MKC3_9BACT|nr:MAG: SMC-Scp complex subunit ScpB [Candidatus Mcinerneyibacterium aminivorans]
MDLQEFKPIIEALIFTSPSPIKPQKIADIVDEEGIGKQSIKDMIEELNEEYELEDRGFKIYKMAGGYEFRSNPEYGKYLKKLFSIKKDYKLSKSVLETLAIVAYNQPVTRMEVEMVRNVDSTYVLNKLIDLEMIKVVGQKDSPGRPLLYGTTSKFLEYFGLDSLSDLPELSEIEEDIG